MTTTDGGALSPRKTFLGHPRGLVILFFTEMWERFSYYGMQTLLVLYMVKYLLLPGNMERVWLLRPLQSLLGGLEGQPLASAIFGLYTSLVYLTPILGGLIADRFLGAQRESVDVALDSFTDKEREMLADLLTRLAEERAAFTGA